MGYSNRPFTNSSFGNPGGQLGVSVKQLGTGAPVAGATVRIEGNYPRDGTWFMNKPIEPLIDDKKQTDENGNYTWVDLPSGMYRIYIETAGYQQDTIHEGWPTWGNKLYAPDGTPLDAAGLPVDEGRGRAIEVRLRWLGQLPYQCQICKKTFANIEDLRAHLSVGHNKCQVCGADFATPQELTEHMIQAHPETPPIEPPPISPPETPEIPGQKGVKPTTGTKSSLTPILLVVGGLLLLGGIGYAATKGKK